MKNVPIDFIETKAIKTVVTEKKHSESVPLVKPPVVVRQDVPIGGTSRAFWSGKSQKLAEQYNYGISLGAFGNNAETITNMYKRLGEAIISSAKRQCNNESKSTEELSCHFTVISAIMDMLAKEMNKQELKGLTPADVIACLHGFIESFVINSIESRKI